MLACRTTTPLTFPHKPHPPPGPPSGPGCFTRQRNPSHSRRIANAIRWDSRPSAALHPPVCCSVSRAAPASARPPGHGRPGACLARLGRPAERTDNGGPEAPRAVRSGPRCACPSALLLPFLCPLSPGVLACGDGRSSPESHSEYGPWSSRVSGFYSGPQSFGRIGRPNQPPKNHSPQSRHAGLSTPYGLTPATVESGAVPAHRASRRALRNPSPLRTDETPLGQQRRSVRPPLASTQTSPPRQHTRGGGPLRVHARPFAPYPRTHGGPAKTPHARITAACGPGPLLVPRTARRSNYKSRAAGAVVNRKPGSVCDPARSRELRLLDQHSRSCARAANPRAVPALLVAGKQRRGCAAQHNCGGSAPTPPASFPRAHAKETGPRSPCGSRGPAQRTEAYSTTPCRPPE